VIFPQSAHPAKPQVTAPATSSETVQAGGAAADGIAWMIYDQVFRILFPQVKSHIATVSER
jgi:hypothetical protein